jgi:hypothetical protein
MITIKKLTILVILAWCCLSVIPLLFLLFEAISSTNTDDCVLIKLIKELRN